MATALIYGAYGYSGELVARRCVERGVRPILAGRNPDAIARLALDLGLTHRVAGLDDPASLDSALAGVSVVLHCAGPFSRTSRPMVDACLRARAHYLDITGEVAVFESLAKRDPEAKDRGIMLLPGAGFDVVPTDCLAAHLKRRLPSATKLALGFYAKGGVSRGTKLTALDGFPGGGLVRRGGVLTPVRLAWKTRAIDFGSGPRKAVTIPWGDVSTAYHSTGIPDVEVYLAVRPRALAIMRAGRVLGPLLSLGPIRRLVERGIRARGPGPDANRRARGRTRVWGEATDAEGRRVVARLEGPEGYTFTAHTAVAILERVLAGKAPSGFQTPSKAYGPDLVLEVDGVRRTDGEGGEVVSSSQARSGAPGKSADAPPAGGPF